MKKGQITMEALLLYGAAILVVLLAVAALIYFGVLDLGNMLPTKCSFESSGVFTCEEYAVDGGSVQVVLANKGTKGVTIIDAAFEPKDSTLATGCTPASFADVDIMPGSKEVVDIPCNVLVESGKRISGKVKITYKLADGVLESTSVGDLTATVK
jgi:hypothetical protein